ncbi:MAG: hypothetical protein ACSHW7_10035 [Patiriisocius sp.]|uniref:hypothetical protein n=1 Tax=Patiriisocius sp. TaxID=2822396 RepID=UPI003EF1A3C1
MKNFFHIILFIIPLGVFSCFSQNNTLANELIENNQLSLLTTIANNRLPLPNGSLNISQVNQVGIDNDATVTITARRSNVLVDQKGNNNLIDVSYNVTEVSANLIQNGNDNIITETVNNPAGSVTSNLSQFGNNLEINKIGANNISNSLQINMQGADKTITIISF